MSSAGDPKPDPHLEAALRHAPDAELSAPPLLRARIIAAAQRSADASRSPQTWQRRLGGWLQAPWRMSGAGTLAAALLAATVLWVGRDEPPAAPDMRPMPEAPAAAPPADAARSEPAAAPAAAAANDRLQREGPSPFPAAPTPPAPAATGRDDARRVELAREARRPDVPLGARSQAAPAERVPLGSAGQSGAPNAPRADTAAAAADARAATDAAREREVERDATTSRPTSLPPAPAPAAPARMPAPLPATVSPSPAAVVAPAAPASPPPTAAPAARARQEAALGEATSRLRRSSPNADEAAAPPAAVSSPISSPMAAAPVPTQARGAVAAGGAAAGTAAAAAAAASPRVPLVEAWLGAGEPAAWRWRAANGDEGALRAGWLADLAAATRGRWKTIESAAAARGEAFTLLHLGSLRARLYWAPGVMTACDLLGRCEQARLEEAAQRSLREALRP